MRHVRYGTLAAIAASFLAVTTFAEPAKETHRNSRPQPPPHDASLQDRAATRDSAHGAAESASSPSSEADVDAVSSHVHGDRAQAEKCAHCSAQSALSRLKPADSSRARLASGEGALRGDKETASPRPGRRSAASRRGIFSFLVESSIGESQLQEPGGETWELDAPVWISESSPGPLSDQDSPPGVLNSVWISDLAENRSGSGLLAALGEETTAASYASGWEESDSGASTLGNLVDEIFWADSRKSIASDCDTCPSAGYLYGNLWSDFNQEYTVWARSEYLYWEGKGDRLPSLVTVSPAGTPQTQGVIPVAGALGQPTTTVIFGDSRFNTTHRSGGRLTVGYGHFSGLQGDYYRLENSVAEFSVTSGGDPILARPFEDVSLAANNALIVAMPNFFDANLMQTFDIEGNVTVKAASEVQSAGVLYRHLVWMESNPEYDGFWRLNLVGGYRFFDLDDSLTIVDTVFPLGGFFALGTSISHIDQFTTENEFHGGEIGLLFACRKRRLSLDVTAKVALGNMHQALDISGVRNVFDPVAVSITTSPEGLLAQSTNIGRHTRDEFAVIPEFGVELGVQLTPRVKAVAGYTFIYASQTRRPGDSIDLLLNRSSPLVGAARPAVHGNDSFFYLQGANGGVEVRY